MSRRRLRLRQRRRQKRVRSLPELLPVKLDRSAKIKVVIFTYNRAEHLTNLLEDIALFGADWPIEVTVYDDASDRGYAMVSQACHLLGIGYVRAEEHGGKPGFVPWVNKAYEDQRRCDAKYFVFLPDDVRLCDDFFEVIIGGWLSIGDERKGCMNLIHDKRVLTGPCWNGIEPLRCCEDTMVQIGWVDGAFLCEAAFLKAIDYNLHIFPERYWAMAPHRGSGLGHMLTNEMTKRGFTAYCPMLSPLAHLDIDSEMNYEDRKRNPIRAQYFAGSDKLHDDLRLCRPVDRRKQ